MRLDKANTGNTLHNYEVCTYIEITTSIWKAVLMLAFIKTDTFSICSVAKTRMVGLSNFLSALLAFSKI